MKSPRHIVGTVKGCPSRLSRGAISLLPACLAGKSSRHLPTPELFPQWAAQTNSQPAELQNPSELGVTHHSVWPASATAKLVLSPTSFGLQEPAKPKRNFMVPLTMIKKVASLDYGKAGQAPNVSLIKIDVEFGEKAAGKHISLLISPSDLLVLVKYLHAANGAAHAP